MVNLYRRVLVNQYEEPEEAVKEETQDAVVEPDDPVTEGEKETVKKPGVVRREEEIR